MTRADCSRVQRALMISERVGYGDIVSDRLSGLSSLADKSASWLRHFCSLGPHGECSRECPFAGQVSWLAEYLPTPRIDSVDSRSREFYRFHGFIRIILSLL